MIYFSGTMTSTKISISLNAKYNVLFFFLFKTGTSRVMLTLFVFCLTFDRYTWRTRYTYVACGLFYGRWSIRRFAPPCIRLSLHTANGEPNQVLSTHSVLFGVPEECHTRGLEDTGWRRVLWSTREIWRLWNSSTDDWPRITNRTLRNKTYKKC